MRFRAEDMGCCCRCSQPTDPRPPLPASLTVIALSSPLLAGAQHAADVPAAGAALHAPRLLHRAARPARRPAGGRVSRRMAGGCSQPTTLLPPSCMRRCAASPAALSFVPTPGISLSSPTPASSLWPSLPPSSPVCRPPLRPRRTRRGPPSLVLSRAPSSSFPSHVPFIPPMPPARDWLALYSLPTSRLQAFAVAVRDGVSRGRRRHAQL